MAKSGYSRADGVSKPDPDRARELAQSAAALKEEGDLDGAIALYARACSVNPKVASWWAEHARLCDRLGHVESALESSERALSLRSDAPAGWFAHRASMLAKMQKTRESLDHYKAAVDRDSTNPRWNAKLAQMYQRVGEPERALYWYEKASEQMPQNVAWAAEVRRLWRLVEGGAGTSDEVGSRLRDPEWYDWMYVHAPEYQAAPEESSYAPLWMTIADRVAECQPKAVLEVACGAGQLAGLLQKRLPGVNYLGFDFSRQAIDLARKNCPHWRFEVHDAFEPDVYASQQPDLLIATEFLEHVEDDLALFRMWPKGATFIGSVPNFDSIAHVRTFLSEKDVRDRYGPCLESMAVEPLDLRSGRLYVVSGTIS